MDQTQLNLPFEVVITKDGSPSLAFHKEGYSQMMHSTQGAYSETEFVYGKALDLAFKEFAELSILSVGLGFGYVELSAAVRAVGKPTKIISYEKEESLRSNWMKFVNNKASDFDSSYQSIVDLYTKKFLTTTEQIKSFFKPSQFILRETLELKNPPAETFNCILFDPFCAKFSPEFWQEEALTDFIQKVSAPQCIFSTYAATGVLNRALKSVGFKLLKQKGFAGKRQSTLAIKGF
jgi:hypothetical protein